MNPRFSLRFSLVLLLFACRNENKLVEAGDDTAPADTGGGDAEPDPDPEEICNGEDDDGDGAVDEDFGDSDADGTADCMDIEECDGVDNDGDGEVDESDAVDASSWYADEDGDGYGAGPALAACEQPAGTVENDEDCDDLDYFVHPGADEICNGEDDDCDGLVDAEDSDLDASSLPSWHADVDGDGFGDPDSSTTGCEAPSGYVDDDSDCDDADGAVNPDAEEICNAVDDDCDGTIDSGACDCDTESYDGRSYLFCETATDWSTAESDCSSWGYALVTVSDSTENEWLADTAVDKGWYTGGLNEISWLGFNDIASEGSWVWSSGEAVSFTGWGSGEPNNSGSGEDCACLNYNAQWNDYSCSASFYYICEEP